MKSKRLMSVNDVKGLWAIMPTPAKAGASNWRNEDTVDLDETARTIDKLIDSGVNAILTMGTLGEAATLTDSEKKKFIAAAVETVRGRVPFFAGTTCLNTRDTIKLTREAYDLGADGTMLGLPMWCAPDVAGAIQFYRDVAEAVPDMSICVYANPEAFKFEFPRPFWAEVSKLPQVVTAKYLNVGMLMADLHLSKRRIRFLPIDMDYYAAARMDPDFMTAFWSSGAVCGPAPVIQLRDEVDKAKKSGDWTRAYSITTDIVASNATVFPNGSFKEFSTYNIGIEKERMRAAGWMRPGPVRPPYHILPQHALNGARIAGEKWAEMHKKYAVPSQPQPQPQAKLENASKPRR